MTRIPSLKVGSITTHFGEEPSLSGTGGSGAIFFSNCNLRCVYCQNFQISLQRINETEYTPSELADEMLKLQGNGCHNINLVSPSHQAIGICSALKMAKRRGLTIPVVYNTNSYDSVSILKLLDGLVDIYLPDIKYSDDTVAEALSDCKKYVEKSRLAVKEMHRQVGDPRFANEIAMGGLIIRLLVLPGNIAGIRSTLEFIAEKISTEVWLSLMSQYNPKYILESGRGEILQQYSELGRRITPAEYRDVVGWADELGFENLYIQDDILSPDYGNPDFSNTEKPFLW